ncbi:unnamed protein product [Rotaria sp. Silwood1]|nr:unnamed protein product [Rotaria sp. Silwood1]CAF5002461.1 unnamed protein product [Rotaria sp. Silwood1]
MDFRALLIQVQDRLSNADRRRLHFLFSDDIPKWYNIDPSMSGTLDLLQWLIEHGKISEEDITILMKAFREINCPEAVNLLMGNDCSMHLCLDTFISERPHIPPCATWSSKVTTVAGIFGKEGDSPLHLNMPTDLAIDLDGNLFVSDEKNNRIQRFAPGETSGVTVIWNLQSPQQIQFDYRTKALYVSEMEGGRVLKWDLQTREGVTIIRNCRRCTGVFVSSKGFIYVVENRRHHVVKYQWDGRSETRLGVVAGITDVSGRAAEYLSLPQAIFVDDVDNLYVADSGNSRVQKFKPDSRQGFTLYEYDQAIPLYVLVDSYDTVYVTIYVQEASNILRSLIVRIPRNGSMNFIGNKDSEYSQQELQGAHGLAFDQVGNMYVADTWNHRIQRYDIDLSQCNHTHQ